MRWEEAAAFQHATWNALTTGVREDAGDLFVVEHPPVITIGRRGRREDLLRSEDELKALGVEVAAADRGGELTWHEPGQIVLYPVVRLQDLGAGPADLPRSLCAALVAWAGARGLTLAWDDAHPGVWDTTGAKVASVGMRIRRGVSTHGMAVHVSNDPARFLQWMVPCGMPGAAVRSLSEALQQPLEPWAVGLELAHLWVERQGWALGEAGEGSPSST
jgi:lipoate-protein ligase B